MEADISILRKTGHFYFALTVGLKSRASSQTQHVSRPFNHNFEFF